MNVRQEIALKSGVIRGWAVALFLIISGALWLGFSADTYFGSDGSFYFAMILDKGGFTEIAPSRAHAELMSQWPLVWALRSGVSDLKLLEVFFGLGIWFPFLLSFVISLYATRENPALIAFYLISLASLNLAGWCLIYGEHMVLLSIAWPIFYLAILRRPLTALEQVLVAALLLVHLKLYETALVSGTLFSLLFLFRAWLSESRWQKGWSCVFAILAAAAVMIALYWILNPRDPENRGHFLGAILGSLAHPYPWMGLSFVVLTALGHLLQSSKLGVAGWVTPLVIGVISLFSPGIMGGISFATRTLTLTALPLLMLVAGMASLSCFRFHRKCALVVGGLILALSILHVRHLQSWLDFRRDFKEILQSERGFVKPADHGGISHWGWTNSVLSYVWSEGEVRAVILNPDEIGYQPFQVKSEMLLEAYLTKKPDFLEAKVPLEEWSVLEDEELTADEVDER